MSRAASRPLTLHKMKFEQVGYFGEVSAETITSFELEFPIIGFEMKVL